MSFQTPPLCEREYILFCDESDRRGLYYSNFYGGIRVPASRLQSAQERLLSLKNHLGLLHEIKWAKTDLSCVERYTEFIRVFFDLIASGHIFMRVMFTHNYHAPTGLTPEQHADSYYLLYYQFLKHGFGLAHIPPHSQPPRFRVYLDEIGDTREQVAKFKGFITGLPNTKTIRSSGGIILDAQDITEVRSHDHILMQALDVVLGSITFRLNNKHTLKLPGSQTRGKRTIAKEQLYRFILNEIKRVTGKKGFNIGITTGMNVKPLGRWSEPYLHWCFTPREFEINPAAAKP